jgi:ABC-type sugar transport systems, permease components
MASPKQQTMRMYKHQRTQITVLFLIPVFAFLGVFIFYSIYNSFHISLYKWSGVGNMTNSVELDNWAKLIKDATFFKALKNNLILVAISVFVELPFGLALAYFLDVGGKKMNFFKVCWFFPLLMSSVAIGTLFFFILDSSFGPIAGFLEIFGMKMPTLLGNTSTALLTVAAVIVWQFVPFYMVYYLAGLNSIPEELYEASVIDGATRAQYFFKCALPMLAPTIRNAVVMQLIGSLKYFDLIYVMTGGGPSGSTELMATYMYKKTFPEMQMSYGATVASAMFIIITTLALLTIKALNKKEN